MQLAINVDQLPFITLIADETMNQTAIPTPATTATGAPAIAKPAVAIEATPIPTRFGGSGGGGGGGRGGGQPSDNTEGSKGWSIGVHGGGGQRLDNTEVSKGLIIGVQEC